MPLIPKDLIEFGARSSRRMGWIYIGGLVFWFLAGGYKGLPLWLSMCIALFSTLLIWSSFSRSKRWKNLLIRMGRTADSPIDEGIGRGSITDGRKDRISTEPRTFDSVWYLSGDSIWRIFRLLAYQDVGKLTVSDSHLEFKGDQQTIVIDRIRRVSYGKQGRDFINNWVKVEYEEAGSCHRAFFADGGSLGWDGILGGTKRILEAIKRLPIAGGNTNA